MSRMHVTPLVLIWALAAGAASGSDVKVFSQAGTADFVAGTLDGTTVDSLGSLRLGREIERVAGIDEPFVLCAAAHPAGWVVGTGSSGRVLLVAVDGSVRTLLEADEPEVFALHVDPDGTVFAGTSPQGKVYRVPPGGEPETFFEPEERYIWALDRGADGELLVATGTEGHLWTVDATGEGRLLLDSEESHLRALSVGPDGTVLIGTADDGLILSLDTAGRLRTLFDADQPEVVAFARGEGGDIWAALVASEAGLAPKEDDENGEDGEAVSSVSVTVESGNGGHSGPRSEVVRIATDGTVERIWSSAEETVYDLAVVDGLPWVATGLEGRVFSWRDGAMLVEQDVEERQVVALAPADGALAFATTNAGALYRTGRSTRSSGSFVSAPLDAGSGATFGVLRWVGERPEGSALEFLARTGMSAIPDRTWSDWILVGGEREVSLAALPPGRLLQWKAVLQSGSGGAPVVSAVEASYRQTNVPPRIASFEVLDPGQVLVPANFNPSDQIYEPAHPNREGIFTSLQASVERDPGRLKTLWRQGFRTLQWKAEDANEDRLQATLSFRPENGKEWLPMEEGLTDSYYSFDATVLADGVYRFRLAVDDGLDNPDDGATSERVSGPIVVDHTPPRVVDARPGEDGLQVTVEDALGPIREAALSRDGGEWEAAVPSDGLLDGRHEVLRLPGGPAHLLLLRLMDASFNVRTFDLSGDLP